ncbi:fatty-acid oxidation protein subunit alpha [Desulfuromonas versatilis]|uniref:enoyl-CoA hydratase n=1 Tax=Desulfuromonas versatilis TaxID=2802975 RepID=A0ABM8HNC2_9BACT|nr:3-hydroxyacyl-CoA dehydrogenase NAD-binding domain-containing protein [Desulfuromonas versatilis]BCR04278.1 fatty-acid oxidation protein subunit alpha [Desulfuromonas versatilis]
MSGKILQSLLPREMEQGPLRAGAETSVQAWANWHLARDEDGVAWLFFDKAGSSVNLLGEEVLRELGEILEGLSADPPRGVVLRSVKPAGFCAGADIAEFRHLGGQDAIGEKLTGAHAVADRLAALPFPSVAVIHGPCLGGGLELALCCRYRLAVPGARLGLPEILLGLHPGLGGTARLTHLIDPLEAMTLMLTGKTLDARRAHGLGLVDALVEERHIREAVRAALSGGIEAQRSDLKDRLLTTRPARQLEARQMRAKAAAKAPPQHYPAPEALISLWEEHGGDPETMRRAEIPSFAGLLTGKTAQNLVRVFFLREKLKKLAGAGRSEIAHLHVIGAGAMGGEIAGWCALQGLRVSLYDPQPETVARAVGKTAELCRKKHFSAARTREVLDRLIPDLRNRGAARADLVIEAVPEKLEIKRQVYREIEPQLKPGALLATNTSSIPLEQLREALEDPGRLVGLHFFNPVARMQLVEVVHHDAVRPEALELARALVGRIDRLPVPVASAPGFLVNRALTPYLVEAMLLLGEGVAAETIDRAALEFGMPVGPVELADRVGLDICLSVAELLQGQLGPAAGQVPGWFRDKVERGELGRKSGQGFYRWKEGEPQKEEETALAGPQLLERLLLPMLNACMACLREGIVADEELLDGAMIFGTGFAPFRGGPLRYARTRGFAKIREALEALARTHGERFRPDPGWTERD